jgi:hypothetical protein
MIVRLKHDGAGAALCLTLVFLRCKDVSGTDGSSGQHFVVHCVFFSDAKILSIGPVSLEQTSVFLFDSRL